MPIYSLKYDISHSTARLSPCMNIRKNDDQGHKVQRRQLRDWMTISAFRQFRVFVLFANVFVNAHI